MEVLLIRHAQTDKAGDYGEAGPPLNRTGLDRARKLGAELARRGINVAAVPAAASPLLRARQTARNAGLLKAMPSPLLAEVVTADPGKTSALLEARQLPEEALTAAEALLGSPPEGAIWVTHGLLMMGVLSKLDKTDPDHFIPDYCEIVPIQL